MDVDDHTALTRIVNSCIGTKFTSRWGSQVADLAVKAVSVVSLTDEREDFNKKSKLDIKR